MSKTTYHYRRPEMIMNEVCPVDLLDMNGKLLIIHFVYQNDIFSIRPGRMAVNGADRDWILAWMISWTENSVAASTPNSSVKVLVLCEKRRGVCELTWRCGSTCEWIQWIPLCIRVSIESISQIWREQFTLRQCRRSSRLEVHWFLDCQPLSQFQPIALVSHWLCSCEIFGVL